MAEKKSGLHSGHRARMREKFRKHGLDGFSEHEIVEMLLYYSVPRGNTNNIAHKIIDKYNTFASVCDASVEELQNEVGISEVGATLFSMIPHLAKAYETSKWARKAFLPDTEAIGQYVSSMYKEKIDEEFALICLDAKRRVIWGGIIVKGTIDSTEAYPRKVVKEALKHNAISVVFAHNHPGGTLAPSVADKQATSELVETLGRIGINVLDHIIVSGNRYFSMREMGFIK